MGLRHAVDGRSPSAKAPATAATPEAAASAAFAPGKAPLDNRALSDGELVEALYEARSWIDLEAKLREWAAKAPDEALAWALKLSEDHQKLALEAIAQGWLPVHPQEALAWYSQNARDVVYTWDFQRLVVDSGPWELSAQLLAINRDYHGVWDINDTVYARWGEKDYKTLLQRIDSFTNRSEQETVVSVICRAMAKDDPMAALAWITGFNATHQAHLGWELNAIVSATTPENRPKIEDWLEKATYSKNLLGGYAAAAGFYAKTDPDRAYHWLLKLADHNALFASNVLITEESNLTTPQQVSLIERIHIERIRDAALTRTVERWAARSPNEAIRYLNETKAMSDKARTQLLQKLEPLKKDSPL